MRRPARRERHGHKIKDAVTQWDNPQVDQATHTEAFRDFAQLRPACREETAQQPIPAKLLDLLSLDMVHYTRSS